MARSWSGWVFTISASETRPSAKTTLIEVAPSTTCRLVRIRPDSTMTTPLPTPMSSPSLPLWPSLPSLGGPIRRTRTTEGRMISQALAAGEGRVAVSSVRSTAASMTFWSSPEAGGAIRCDAATSASAAVMPSATSRNRSYRALRREIRRRRRVKRPIGGAGGFAAGVAGAATVCRTLPMGGRAAFSEALTMASGRLPPAGRAGGGRL